MNSPTSANTTRRQSLIAHVLLIAVTLVWGACFPLVKAALREVSPLLFNLLRMILASAILLAVSGRSLRGLNRAQIKISALVGVLLALGYTLQTAGLAHTTPSKSAFLTGLVVVFVPLFGALPGIRVPGTSRPHGLVFLGAVVAFAGIILLTSQPGAGTAILAGMHLGEWLTLGCAVVYAFHMLTLARGALQVPARAIGTLQIVFATLTMAVLLPIESHPHVTWTPLVVIALAVTAVFATAIAFTVQSYAQQHLPASHTALICTLEPVFAWLTSLLFLGEGLGPRALAGAGLILLGILLAEIGPGLFARAAMLPLEHP